jgi:hypothetical protein
MIARTPSALIVRASDPVKRQLQGFDLAGLGVGLRGQLVDIDIPNVATIHIPSPANGGGLPIDGPWEITFRLVSPGGKILASAAYQTAVVGCTAPGGGCSPG